MAAEPILRISIPESPEQMSKTLDKRQTWGERYAPIGSKLELTEAVLQDLTEEDLEKIPTP